MRYWAEKTERAPAANQRYISFYKPFFAQGADKRKGLKQRFDDMITFSQLDAWVCYRRKSACIWRLYENGSRKLV